MYLIKKFPVELNDNVLIHISSFDLALQFQRFWAAGQIYKYNKDIDIKVPESLLENIVRYMDMDKKYTVLYYASICGYESVVQILLSDPRVDPSNADNTAIRRASYNGHSTVMELLLADPRVDPSALENDAIRWAS